MKQDVMVIPLRVPKEVGRGWKLEAVKQDKSVQRWILDKIDDTTTRPPKPAATASKRVVVASKAQERNKALAQLTGSQDVADKLSPVGQDESLLETCGKCGDVFKISELFMHPKHFGVRWCKGCVENDKNGQ